MSVRYRHLLSVILVFMAFVMLMIVAQTILTPAVSAQRPGIQGPFRASVKPIPIKIDWAVASRLPPKSKPQIFPLHGRAPNSQKTAPPPALTLPLPNPPASLTSMPSPIQNFEGIDFTNVGWPPDTNGDVGPNNYIQSVNTSFAVFNKTGTVLAGPVTFDAVWGGANSGTPCDNENQGDPVSIYDPIADRWIVSDFAFSTDFFGNPITPFYECILVSVTSDPVGSYWAYAIPANPTNVNANVFGDYPKFGMWRDGYYMTMNMFDLSTPSPNDVWARVFAFDRSAMIAGETVYFFSVDLPVCHYTDVTCPVQSVLPANVRGSLPPDGSPEYLANIGAPQTTAGLPYSSTNVLFWKMQVTQPYSTGTATLNGPFTITVPSFTEPLYASGGSIAMNLVPQPGTTNKLDTLGDRMMYPLQYRRLPSWNAESLWATHSITQNGHTAIRWYEFRINNGGISLHQSGNFDNANDGLFRWMPSIAADKNGNAAVGYSIASSVLSPSIRYAGRLFTDTLGQLPQGEATLLTGKGSQTSNPCCGLITRWGDYSAMSVDPADDCTFFYTQEYYTTTGSSWRTRVGSFKFDLNPSHTCTSINPNSRFAPLIESSGP